MGHPLEMLNSIQGSVCVVGSLNADLMVRTHALPRGGQTVAGQPLQILPGGKSANQAVCASLLGCTTNLIGALGTDVHAEVLRRSLDRAGVDATGVTVVDVPTGTAIITVDEQGENTIVISAGANGEVTPEVVRRHRNLIEHASVLGLCMEIPYESVLEAARIAHASGCTTVFNLSPLLPVTEELWNLVDIVIFNEHELIEVLKSFAPALHSAEETSAASYLALNQVIEQLKGSPSPHDDLLWKQVSELLKKLSISRTVITLGGAGAVVLDDHIIEPIAPQKVSVVDTTGCGDSFMGAILAALASGYSLSQGALLASYVAAYSATGQGAQNSYGSSHTITTYWTDQEK